MRIRYFVGIVFIVLFCISGAQPVNLSSSYDAPGIGIESQFTPSAYGDKSPQSITSFSETVADDEFLYPDSETNDTYRDAGTISYSDDCSDIARWTNFGPSPWDTHEIIDSDWLHLGFTGAEADDYARTDNAGPDSVDEATTRLWFVFNWTHTDFDLGEDELDLVFIGTVSDTFDLTTYSIDTVHWIDLDWVSADTITGIRISTTVDNAEAVEVWFDWITLDSRDRLEFRSDVYSESFADISEWTTSDTSISTDNDVATITENGAGSTGRAYASFSSIDFFEYYYEFRIESMTATTSNLEFYDGAAYNTLKTFTAAGTYKGIISDSDASTMERIGFLVGSESGNLLVDYLRISLSNESGGWVHDGSTTKGVTAIGDATISSDGSTLSIIKGVGGSAAYIYVDTTATRAKYDPDYYPFLEVEFSDACVGNVSSIIVDDGTDFYNVKTDFEITQTTYRFNVRALTDNDIQRVLIYASTTRVEIEHIKAYSIANFTVSQSGTSVDDILYVDSNILYCSGTSFTSFVLDHDPALLVEVPPYKSWNMNTSSGTPEVDFYDGSWLGYSNETAGEFSYLTTVTDLRFKFTASANIISLTFIDLVRWNINGVARIYFSVPFDEWGMNMALIILGLVMIPVSTVYLAYGAKHDHSSDRLFYGLIIFMVGCGLFIGGILP